MSSPNPSHSISIRLSSELLTHAGAQVDKARRPYLSQLLQVGGLVLLLSLLMAIWALVGVHELGASVKASQMLLMNTLQRPDVSVAMRAPEVLELMHALSYVGQYDFQPAFNRLFWLVQLGACLPLGVLLIGVYRHHQGVRQPEHGLDIRFDADGIRVRRGMSDMVHPWAAVTKLRFTPQPGDMTGVIVIELEYGYSHVWPSGAFNSREEFMLTGQRLSALYLTRSMAQPAVQPA